MKLKVSISLVLALTAVILSVPAVNYGLKFLTANAENGDGETNIDWRTLYGSNDLTSVKIPRTVTSIGVAAFSGCTRLTAADIPDSVTSIGIEAFSGCSSLTSAELPPGVTYIGDGAFSGCVSLSSVNIPDSVTEIGGDAFAGCSSLTSVEIPGSLTEIKSGVFSGCVSLTSAKIREGVTGIGYKAFSDCRSLSFVEIPDSVRVIDRWAFSGCSSLTSVKIPEGVTYISDGMFYGCGSLTCIKIPEGTESINEGAFYGCGSLTSAEIPDSVKSIAPHAFRDCPKLTVYGVAGSYAESYANENGIPFKPVSSLSFDDAKSGVKAEVLFAPRIFLSVEGIEDADDSAIAAYNIAFRDKEGNAVQPYDAVIVKIPVPQDSNGEECRVYRREADGAYTDMNAVYSEGFAVFKTGRFGSYILSTEDLTHDGKTGKQTAAADSKTEREITSLPEENSTAETLSETETEITTPPEEDPTAETLSETETEITSPPEEDSTAETISETETEITTESEEGPEAATASETDKTAVPPDLNGEASNKTENGGSLSAETTAAENSEAESRLPKKNSDLGGINQGTGLAISAAPVILTAVIAAIASKKKK